MRLPAQIDAGHGSRLLNCIIDDVSEFGARMTLATGAKLPRDFVLLLTTNGGVHRCCHILWHDELELGVQFLPAPQKDLAAIVELDG